MSFKGIINKSNKPKIYARHSLDHYQNMNFSTGLSLHFRHSENYFDAGQGKCLTISDWMITLTYPMERLIK